jgi:hypothetical protein
MSGRRQEVGYDPQEINGDSCFFLPIGIPLGCRRYASAHHRRSKSRLSSKYSFWGEKTSRVIVPS